MPNRFLILLLVALIVPITSCGGSPSPAAAPSEEARTVEEAEASTSPAEPTWEESLRRLAAGDDAVERRRALARLALHFRSEKRLDEAAAAFAAAAEANEVIRPHLLVQLAEVEIERNELSRAATALRRVIEGHAGSAVAAEARLRLASVLAKSGDAGAARTALQGVAGVAVDEFTDEEFARLASDLEGAGLEAEAAALRLRVLQDYVGSRWAETHYTQLTRGADSPIARLSYADSIRLAERLGRVNRYDQSLDLLDRIAKRFPDRTGSADYRYARATSLFNSRHYTRMTEEPSRPGEPYYLAIEFLRGRAYWRSDRPQKFVETMNRIIRDHPKSAEAGAAKLQLAKYYQTDERDLDRSARLLEEGIAHAGPGSDGQNLWTLAWTYIQAERYDRALATFETYLAKYPAADYTSNALFWSGKIHERRGDIAKRDAFFRRLLDLYPYNYYSYRARAILGDPSLPPDSVESGHSFPAAALEPAADARLAVPVELRAVGLDREAATELKRIAGGSTDPVLAWRLADFYAEGGEPLRAIGILNRRFGNLIRHGGTGIPPRFWEVLYPRMYWDEIRAAAEASRLDPWLMLAVIRQESAWEPSTVSSAGAVGLMQIMPHEAGQIASAAGIGEVDRAALFDPRVNIRVGAAELRQKLDAMKGHPVLAIASYNAGETAVRRWLSRTPVDELDVFVDSIPYAETRLYVMTVSRNLQEYRRVYGDAD